MQDSSGPAGFTAVNGDTNGKAATSFRPSASDESAPRSHDDAVISFREQASDEAHPLTKRDSGPGESAHVTDRDDRSPPAKRKRTSLSPGEHSRRLTPSTEDDATSERSSADDALSEKRSDSKRSESPPLTKKREYSTLDVRSSEPAHSESPPHRAWKPSDVTPETSRQLADSLQSHLSSQNPADRSIIHADRSLTSPDSGAPASSQPPAATVNASATPQDGERRKPKREFSRRTKSGCHTCRYRKKKCGEERPECKNCHKGNFVCAGYGPKPHNYRPTSKSAAAKGSRQSGYNPGFHHDSGPGYQQYNGPPHHPSAPGPPPHPDSHWQQRPPQPLPHDTRPPAPPHIPPPHPHGYDPYQQRPRDSWSAPQPHSDPSIHLQYNTLPRVDYGSIAPAHAHAPPDPRAQPPPLPHPPAQNSDPWYPGYRSVAGPGTTHGSHESVGSSSHHRLHNSLAPLTSITLSERNKMILGQTVQPFVHTELLNDASDCSNAVEEYNRVAQARVHYVQDQVAACLERILDPAKRIHRLTTVWNGPPLKGRCGHRTLIKAPFYCEFGYNLKIGDSVIIRPNCFFSDPCEIVIGNNCTIGEGVHFAGWNTNINPQSPSGTQGEHRGGAIIVGDNVKIGAGAVILAFRRIGEGAVIGAGSVVTKNVAPRTVVCGNPARVVRELPESGVAETRQRNLIQQENESMLREMESMQRRSDRELRSATIV